jgi:hypothetical protein
MRRSEGKAILAGIGVAIGGFVGGAILGASGHWIIGMCLGLAAIPVGFIVWTMWGERI